MKIKHNCYNAAISACIISQFYSTGIFANTGDKSGFEMGFEHTELAQNNYRDLGSSNYTFFIGKRFESDLMKDWAWRLSFINVELSNEHLRDESSVCCINGDRSNLEGNLEQHRLYLEYLPYTLSWTMDNKKVSAKLISSFGIGYNRWVTRDIVANEEHNVEAITVGGLFSIKTTFYENFFIEPALDIAYIAYKNKNINETVGSATLDRSEHYAFSLLVYVGYIF